MEFEGKAIDAIIFDLGGVILNIDYELPVRNFEKLGVRNFQQYYSQAAQTGLFDNFETGKINTAEFLKQVGLATGSLLDDDAITEAWNSILLDLPAHRLQLLQKIAEHHRIFLLSNTNEMHISSVNEYLQREYGISSLNPYFEKVYYSYEVGMRKPDAEVFEFVLRDAGLNAGSTLFIDDSVQHIEGARGVGLNAYHLTSELADFLEGKL